MTTNDATVLTEEFLLKRSNETSLSNIKSLNLFALNLNDLRIFRQSTFSNLTILNLVQNNLTNIDCLIFCPNITELYLRKNNLNDLVSLAPLTLLPRLLILWLDDNPLSSTSSSLSVNGRIDPYASYYRTYVLYLCKTLEKLDTWTITETERTQYHPQQYTNTKDEIVFEELVQKGNTYLQKLRIQMKQEKLSTVPSVTVLKENITVPKGGKKDHVSVNSMQRNSHGPVRVHHEGILNSFQQNSSLQHLILHSTASPIIDNLGSPLINSNTNASSSTRSSTPLLHNINISFPHNHTTLTKDSSSTGTNTTSNTMPNHSILSNSEASLHKGSHDPLKVQSSSSTGTIFNAVTLLVKELDRASLEKLEKIIHDMLSSSSLPPTFPSSK